MRQTKKRLTRKFGLDKDQLIIIGRSSLFPQDRALKLLNAAVTEWRGKIDRDEPINGADAVDWLIGFIDGAQALLEQADAEALGLRRIIADLVAWADELGGWDAPVWERARQAIKEERS